MENNINNTLPADIKKQIEQEAEKKYPTVEIQSSLDVYTDEDRKEFEQKAYIAGATEYAPKLEQAKKLLEKVLVMNEMWGDLPGEFINEVKTFLL
jgi:hypothetical protein